MTVLCQLIFRRHINPREGPTGISPENEERRGEQKLDWPLYNRTIWVPISSSVTTVECALDARLRQFLDR